MTVTSLTLTNGELEVVILPENGGAISEASYRGIQFMARPPRSAIAPVRLGDEADWVRAWNGGWQPLLPNAGTQYLEGRFPQGFHGNASQAEWRVEDRTETEVLLAWHDEELQSYRSINLAPDQITASGRLVNLSNEPRQFTLTEHLVFGDSFLKSDVKLHINDRAQFMELNYDGTAKDAPYKPWSEVVSSDWSSVNRSTPARLGLIKDVAPSGVTATGESLKVTVTWDTENLPFLWIWEEMGSTQSEPWLGEYFCLGIEPSTSPHGAGLGEALRTGTVNTLGPKERFHWWVALKVASTRIKE